MIIDQGQLSSMIDIGLTVKYIANFFGVSQRTIERRLNDFNLNMRRNHTDIDDENLDQVVKQIVEQFLNLGYRRLNGFLRARSLTVQRDRIRSSLRRVNPEGIFVRSLQLTLVRRRKYAVKGPLALWHVDGNHKLIRYVLMVRIWGGGLQSVASGVSKNW